MNWYQAEAQAVIWGGHLVTINDANENAWLVSTYGGSVEFWIGFTDKDVEGQWRWISGEISTYTCWYYNACYNFWEPNDANEGEDAASINQKICNSSDPAPGQWNDIPINGSLSGIVEVNEIPFIQLSSPNGGENWQVDSVQNITWNSTGPVGNVKIEYSTNNGTNWTIIASSTANNGSYLWTIPDKSSTQCIVKVSDVDGYPADLSDNTFSIIIPKGINILSLKSKYNGTPHFIAGVDFPVEFTADVDWGDKIPSKVRFITPKGSYYVPTIGTTASKTFNIATDFNACTYLRAIAISQDGTQSAEKAANMVVTPKFLSSVQVNNYNISDKQFYYKASFGLNLVDEQTKEVRQDIPLFGKNDFIFKYIPQVDATISMNGDVECGLDWDEVSIKEMKVAGHTVNLTPGLQVNGVFNYSQCKYNWSGSISLSASVNIKKSWPFVLTIGPVPLPMYTKACLNVSVNDTLSLEAISPVKLNGEIGPNITAWGSLGVGLDEIINVEGWIQGATDFVLQFPNNPTVKKLTITLSGGVNGTIFIFKWEDELLTWNWDIYSSSSGTAGASLFSPGKPTLIPREYLKTRGTFNRTNASSPLQSSVLPYSHAHLSSNNTKMNLVWVRDDSFRTSINRTAAVYSSYNGSNWSQPQTIWDDGTADFHPKSVTFPNGTTAAIWEDVKKKLADDAPFEDMLENMEISVSVFNPNTKNWESSQRITSNHYFDFAPKISGNSINSVMIVWLANESNEVRGSAAAPTKIYYSIYDGTNWKTASSATEVPMGVLKYDLLYDGTKGYIVLSLDTDDDPSTIDDHELYRLTYENGAWGGLSQLTNDDVIDGNPGLARDSYGNIVLTWVKYDGVYSTTNFEMNNKATVFSEEYSSNLGDLKMVSSRNGRLAMIWAESSDNYSDLYVSLYDRDDFSWSVPEQITSDTETERNITAVFCGENTLVSVYNRNNIVENRASTTTSTGKMLSYVEPEIVSTDLVMVQWELEEEELLNPTIQLDRMHLYFGAVINGACTGPQAVLISNSGTGILNWSADDNASWLLCTPSSGYNWGELTVSADAEGLSAGMYTGTVTVSDPNSTNAQQSVEVTLTVYRNGESSSPFGEFSTPVDGSNVQSSVPVTGWVLDDIGVENVGVYREEGNSLVFVGNAVFVEGARLDIEQAFPGYPMNHCAGWGYMMLTNFLPNGGNGTFTLHAIATDVEGQQVTLGTKTIICDNAIAIKPFGAIDTPAQGGVATGSSFRNQGWVLTPPPNIIPTDGSSINVFVDGVNLGHPSYNVYRSDIAAFFPGYANSDGAHAYFDFDTTTYENGIHSIYWTAEDSAENSDGIGSRYFTIQNTGTSSSKKSAGHQWHAREKEPYTFSQIAVIPVNDLEPIKMKKNFRINSGYNPIEPDEEGTFNIKIRELERIVIELSNESSVVGGNSIIGNKLRPLPIGSTLDTGKGIFYWQPGHGFLGEYRFVFVEKMQNGEMRRKNVIVNIMPKSTCIVKDSR